MRMLPSALRRNIGHGSFQELQQCLLHALAGDIACDGGILALSCDLVDFINVDDPALRTFDIEFGRLQELDDDVLHIFAYIACFCQGRRIGNCERNIQHLRHRLGKQRLAAAGRSDQQNVALLQFDIVFHAVQNPLVVVVHRNREDLFGPVLSDDILIQICLDLHRFREAVEHHRKSVIAGHRFRVKAVPDNAHAHPDAIIADITAVSRNQAVYLALRLPAK